MHSTNTTTSLPLLVQEGSDERKGKGLGWDSGFRKHGTKLARDNGKNVISDQCDTL